NDVLFLVPIVPVGSITVGYLIVVSLEILHMQNVYHEIESHHYKHSSFSAPLLSYRNITEDLTYIFCLFVTFVIFLKRMFSVALLNFIYILTFYIVFIFIMFYFI